MTSSACIIGGGISGLTAARVLRDAGIRTILVERQPLLGGVWCGAKMYENVRLQQHKTEFYMDHGLWPDDTPDFPSMHHVRQHINAYIEKHSLEDVARTSTAVKGASFDHMSRKWRVTLANGDTLGRSSDEEIVCDWLGIATGQLGQSKKGRCSELADFDGTIIHSSEYYRSQPFESKHVVVLGMGASSTEIAGDLAEAGVQVTMLARREARADWVLPRFDEDGLPLSITAKGLFAANTSPTGGVLHLE